MIDVYSETNYKQLFKKLIKDNGKYTLKKIAAKIDIQYTYLSKVLKDESRHLSEDHVFAVCNLMELHSDEIDYVFLLRSIATTSDTKRKNYIKKKLGTIRSARSLKASVKEFNTRQLNREMEYLFDPYALIVVISLTIKKYRDNPRLLCANLGISPKKLREILQKLDQLEFIQLNKNSVESVLTPQFHYGTNHPLMRAHQSILKKLCASQIIKITEDEKKSFMVTFSANESAFSKIKDKFQVFIKEVETIVTKAEPENTYQLNFDFFKWF